jgi:hypothetical protein
LKTGDPANAENSGLAVRQSAEWHVDPALHPAYERLPQERSRTTPQPSRSIVMFYNFGRVHQTLRVAAAMKAGVSDHVWSIEEIVGLWGL